MEALRSWSRSRGLIFGSTALAIGLSIAGLLLSPVPAASAARAGVVARAAAVAGSVAAEPGRGAASALGAARAISPGLATVAAAARPVIGSGPLGKDRSGRPERPKKGEKDDDGRLAHDEEVSG